MSAPIGKSKLFRDPVHGYISVPEEWCAAFIDSVIFQRLRHIEQTSMRPLYPSARHDRFAHSLGVYHLAKLAFGHLRDNTDKQLLDDITLDEYEASFLAAALMHDCGHAIFSHAFENLYKERASASAENTRAEDYLFGLVDDEQFIDDYRKRLPPAPHEVFSAAVFLEHYRDKYVKLGLGPDPRLVARMITGCLHATCTERRWQIENSLISLINGRTIDVDKLDYVLRDTWASGVDNVSIDVRRLLSALELAEVPTGSLGVVFRKSALSVLQAMVDGRNYLYRWIYSHHTVVYYQALLRDAVRELDRILSPKGKQGAFLTAISSEEAFREPVPVGKSLRVYLPCDDDVYSLLKAHRNDSPRLRELVEEILSRKASRTALWKTQAEFEILFDARTLQDRAEIRDSCHELLKGLLDADQLAKVVVEEATAKVIDFMDFDESRLWVKLGLPGNDNIMSFQRIASKLQGAAVVRKSESCFYVFVPTDDKNVIAQCIEALRTAKIAT